MQAGPQALVQCLALGYSLTLPGKLSGTARGLQCAEWENSLRGQQQPPDTHSAHVERRMRDSFPLFSFPEAFFPLIMPSARCVGTWGPSQYEIRRQGGERGQPVDHFITLTNRLMGQKVELL